MTNFIKLYLTALAVFVFIDGIWLGLVARNFYADQIGHLMKTDINWLAAVAFYLLFLVGLIVFVVSPALAQKSLITALSLGALFGLITYATYDLTNLATLKDWPLLVTAVDLVWGAVLAAAVSGATFLLATRFQF